MTEACTLVRGEVVDKTPVCIWSCGSALHSLRPIILHHIWDQPHPRFASIINDIMFTWFESSLDLQALCDIMSTMTCFEHHRCHSLLWFTINHWARWASLSWWRFTTTSQVPEYHGLGRAQLPDCLEPRGSWPQKTDQFPVCLYKMVTINMLIMWYMCMYI